MGSAILSWRFRDFDSGLGFGISPWTVGMSALGASLTVLAGVISLAGPMRRKPAV
jgi:hypothetical protein